MSRYQIWVYKELNNKISVCEETPRGSHDTIICSDGKGKPQPRTPPNLLHILADYVRQTVDLRPAEVKFVCSLYRLITDPVLLAWPTQEPKSVSQCHSAIPCPLLIGINLFLSTSQVGEFKTR